MQIVNQNEQFLTLGWMVLKLRPRQLSAAFFVKGTFKLVPDKPALPNETEPDLVSGDIHFDDDEKKSIFYPSDFVPLKPRADLLLNATAYAPGAAPVTRLRAGFKIGTFSKDILVIGKRVWKRSLLGPRVMSEPEPFREMPIVYENAFGGKGYEKNPIGKGRKLLELPNIENLDKMVPYPGNKLEPAGFGALANTWQQRASLVGTYTDKWLKERWPWFPEDFDWGYHNAAPRDQQVEGYLQGDEKLTFWNFHPEHSVYQSSLPGLRVRCFLNERINENDDHTTFREVPLKLDTLWADLDLEKLVLVWRGVTNIRSVKLREFENVFVLAEPLSEPPHDTLHYQALMQQRLHEEEAEFEIEEGEEVDIDTEVDLETPDIDIDREINQANKEFADLEAEASKAEAGQIARAVEMGVDPKFFEQPPVYEEPHIALASQIAALRDERPDFVQQMEEAFAEEEAAEQQMAAIDEEAAELEDEGEPPLTRESVIEGSAQHESFEEQDFSGLDLSELALSGLNFSSSNLSKTSLSRCLLAGVNLAGADLTGADLTGADLTGAVLDEADLSDAILSGAKLTGVSLSSADLSNLDLAGTDFSNCTGEYADFSNANLSGAKFVGAKLPRSDFDRCNIEGADFRRADLQDADFSGVQARHINMEEANITGLRSGEQSDFTEGNCKNVQGSGSMWEGCILDRADYSRSDLSGATFAEASLVGTVFDLAEMSNSNFDDADLVRAVFSYANLLKASFERADLTEANLEGSNLYEAGFAEAVTEKANFQAANLKQTLLA